MRITQTPPAALIAIHAALASAVHGVTGDVVGISDVQALTNKTLTAPVLTGSITVENAGAGADPVILSNSTVKLLDIIGEVSARLDLSFKSGTAYWLSLVHAITANRIVTFPDKAITVAGIVDLEEYLMIGAGNAKWRPLVYAGEHNATTVANRLFEKDTGIWLNVSAEDGKICFDLPLPVLLGSKTLQIKAVRFGLTNADATNYVAHLYTHVVSEAGRVVVEADTTDRTSAGEYTLTLASVQSMAGYNIFSLTLDCVVATLQNLGISHVEAEVYYA